MQYWHLDDNRRFCQSVSTREPQSRPHDLPRIIYALLHALRQADICRCHEAQIIMKLGLKRRLFHSVGATSLGPISTAIVQLVSVPIFLHFWGSRLYGEWLILSAIPIYLALTDFGFGPVAANDMTMLVARGERNAALEVFQSAWVMTTAVSVSFGFLITLGLWAFPVEKWLGVTLLSRGQVIATLCVLCAFMLLDMQWTVIEAGFRCDGNYALGTLLGAIIRFGASVAGAVAVVCHAFPLGAAVAMLVTRMLGNWIGQLVLKRKSQWLSYGFRNAHLSVIRKLLKPALAYMAFPAGNAFSLQGMTIVVGVTLGPIAVVVLSTTRTLTRFVYQMVSMITNSVWAELSAAFGSGNIVLARNLHRCAFQASLACSLAGVLFLALFGNAIYGNWTHHNVGMDHRLFYLLLVEVLANCMWFTSSIVAISCNKHVQQAAMYLLTTVVSVPLAYFLMLRYGLTGVAISLLIGDFWMINYVLGHSLAILHDNFGEFGRALLRPPSLGTESCDFAS